METSKLHSAIEFHDSEVSQVLREGDDLLIRFSAAYVHQSSGMPGVDSGEGFIQAAELRLSRAQGPSSLTDLIGRLSHGAVHLPHDRIVLLPLPCQIEGPVTLELAFSNGERLMAVGSGISLTASGRAQFVEHFRC